MADAVVEDVTFPLHMLLAPLLHMFYGHVYTQNVNHYSHYILSTHSLHTLLLTQQVVSFGQLIAVHVLDCTHILNALIY